MMIKKNDTVLVITGKDKGKKGKVNEVKKTEDRIVVEGVNKMYRHRKPRRQGEKGQRIEFFAPFHVSNAMVICHKCGKATRIGSKRQADGKKLRVCKKCGENL